MLRARECRSRLACGPYVPCALGEQASYRLACTPCLGSASVPCLGSGTYFGLLRLMTEQELDPDPDPDPNPNPNPNPTQELDDLIATDEREELLARPHAQIAACLG